MILATQASASITDAGVTPHHCERRGAGKRPACRIFCRSDRTRLREGSDLAGELKQSVVELERKRMEWRHRHRHEPSPGADANACADIRRFAYAPGPAPAPIITSGAGNQE